MNMMDDLTVTTIEQLGQEVTLAFASSDEAAAFLAAVLAARPDLREPPAIEALPFHAGPPEGRYPALLRVEFGEPWRDHLAALGAIRIWGEENVTVEDAGTLSILYPAGTSAPSDAAHGGAGFVLPLGPGCRSAVLAYTVWVPDDFNHVKGGKLPGAYGGDAPTGGADASSGWTTRLMWRTDGELEAYVYAPNSKGEYGESVGRGMASLVPGANRIVQEVYLNDVGAANGILRLWVNDSPVMQAENIAFRTSEAITIDGLIFSTFFGGNGEEWRTPLDQRLAFSDFAFHFADTAGGGE